MEVVTLKVKVENSELKKLQADVANLNGTTINIRKDGLQGLEESASAAAQSVNAMNTAMVKTSQTWKDGTLVKSIDTVNDELGRTVKFTTQIGKESVSITKTVTENFEKQRRAGEKAAAAEKKAINEATAAYEKYAAAQIKAQESVTTAMQRRINYITGVDGDSPRTPNVTAANSMFGKLDTETFKAYTSGVINAEEAMKGFGKAAKDATEQSRLLGDSLGKIILKMAAWQVLGTAISKVIGAFREAVNTMKAVDTQLTNIQKVSNLTAEELDRVGENAYQTASKYGVAVDEYLSSFYEMQKAGLGESAGDMAELATKTMLVGDTTADVANKFLIGVNAAWDLKGSLNELSKVVDEADFVNNNYATTLEKMADGMPIVASTAANMNMSFEETLALLATINAKTQETGRKTATAVRSFLIAISGQVGEFVDDTGETYEVTAENVEALTDALKLYGNEAVQSAIQTGEIINPMEALNSLAQAYKDGLIDDISLQEMLINVAGRMRYNQLVTIVKDLASESSTYRDILEQLPEAAGTADAEIGVMLSSWEAKTQILSNTWAQFISHLIDTGAVKGALDGLINTVELLDSEGAKSVVTLVAMEAAFVLLIKAVKWAIPAIKGLTTALLANPLFWGAAAIALIFGVIKAIDAVSTSIEEQREIVADLTDEVARLRSEYDALAAKENRTAEEEKQLALLERELEIQERLLAIETKRQFEKEWEGTVATTTHGGGSNTHVTNGATYQKASNALETYNRLQTERAEIEGKILSLTEKEAHKLPSLTKQLDKLDSEILDNESDLLKLYENLSQYDDETINSARNSEQLREMLKTLADVLGITSSSTSKADAEARNYVVGLIDEASQAGRTKQAIYELVLQQIQFNSVGLDVRQKAAALYQLAIMAGTAADSLRLLKTAMSDDPYAAKAGQAIVARYGSVENYVKQAMGTVSESAYVGAGYTAGSNRGTTNEEAQRAALQTQKKAMEAQRDEEIAAIDAQIDELKKQHQAQEDANDLAEKQLAVEKSQEELLRVQNERNVRFYNQTTGQWEWVANSVDVIKAEQAVADAQRALAEEEAQQAYEAQLAVLEAQKEGLQEYWKNAIGRIDDVIDELGEKISNLSMQTTVYVNGQEAASTSTPAPSSTPSGDSVKELQRTLNNMYGAGLKVDGIYGNATKNAVKNLQSRIGVSQTGEYDAATRNAWENYLRQQGATSNPRLPAALYDSGGILHGLGGIKATQEDEIVLPPDVTKRLLNPDRSSLYATVLDTMRFFTKGMGSVAGSVDNRIGSQHNGNVYQLGGITISEGQAQTMTVYDLARLSRNLTLFKS